MKITKTIFLQVDLFYKYADFPAWNSHCFSCNIFCKMARQVILIFMVLLYSWIHVSKGQIYQTPLELIHLVVVVIIPFPSWKRFEIIGVSRTSFCAVQITYLKIKQHRKKLALTLSSSHVFSASEAHTDWKTYKDL